MKRLIEVRPTRGFIVQQFSTTDIYDAIELRGSLEGMAARLAAERLTDGGDLTTLRELSGLMDGLFRKRALSLGNFTSYIDLNAKFHTALLDLSRSRILRRAVKQVCAQPFASPSAFLLKQRASADSLDLFQVALDHHHSIIEAIGNREGMRAETLAREHARLARRNLDSALVDRDLWKTVRGAKLVDL